MDRKLFLARLIKLLPADLSATEQADFLNYYDEMIHDYVMDGYTEEEAVAMIGDPNELVENADFNRKTQKKRMSLGIILLLILGFPLWGSLLLAAFCLTVSAYILLWVPLIVSGSFVAAGIGGGLFAMLTSFFARQDGLFVAITQFGAGTALLGVGILSLVFTWYFGGKILKATGGLTFWLIERMKSGVKSYEF